MVKRGQAAMEFLMTYGWAILVVLAAIGALAYFGVLSPDNFLPDSCRMGGEFGCLESQVTSDGSNTMVYLGLQNNVGSSLTNVTVTVDGPGCGIDDASTGEITNSTNPSVPNGQRLEFGSLPGLVELDCGAGAAEGERFQADITISYLRSNAELRQTASGTLQTRVIAE